MPRYSRVNLYFTGDWLAGESRTCSGAQGVLRAFGLTSIPASVRPRLFGEMFRQAICPVIEEIPVTIFRRSVLSLQMEGAYGRMRKLHGCDGSREHHGWGNMKETEIIARCLLEHMEDRMVLGYHCLGD